MGLLDKIIAGGVGMLDTGAGQSPNGYVQENWPGNGINGFGMKRPDTFFTPPGMPVPPGGRHPTIGEMYDLEKGGGMSGLSPAVMRLVLQSLMERK